MGTARLVVTEIRLRQRARELLGKQAEQGYDIGLLDYLGTLCSCAANDHVGRVSAVGIVGEIDKLQIVVACELLIEASHGIEAGNKPTDRVVPIENFVVAQRKLFRKRGGAVGPARAKQINDL